MKKTNKALSLLMVLAVVLCTLSVCVFAAPAEKVEAAATYMGIYRIKNVYTGKYLDLMGNGTSNGTHVQQYQYGADYASEKWKVYILTNGNMRIESVLAVNKYLDGRANCVAGAQVVIYENTDCPEQEWYTTAHQKGVKLSPTRNLSLYLTVENSSTANNAKVKLAGLQNNSMSVVDAQVWVFEKV